MRQTFSRVASNRYIHRHSIDARAFEKYVGDEKFAGDIRLNLDTIYAGRSVLVTGHTGFKGGWLSSWLLKLGADVHGIALPPLPGDNLFDTLRLATRMDSRFVNICDREAVKSAVSAAAPEIVFHLAAQPLVRRSYEDPLETFETNVLGTANVLEACRAIDSVKAVVSVTTDKVYSNREWAWPYREIDRLGGLDPYSASKACAELVSFVYQQNLRREDQSLCVATARGGNVIGGGDWSKDRIVPDIVRAIVANAPIVLRNPGALRPWQHVLELCEGYLELGARLLAREPGFDEAWNFGPNKTNEVNVGTLVRMVLENWRKSEHPVEIKASPLHEAQLLRLDISKALARMNWKPRLGIEETIFMTINWFETYYRSPQDAARLTEKQIDQFELCRRGRK